MSQPARLLLLYVAFFISGVAGLVYEVVWSRYLALFIGSTGQAHIIVLSTYMGGLALGALLFGRRADRARSPLKLYVLLEVGIGLYGLAYPWMFEPIRQLFIAVARAVSAGEWGLHVGSIMAAGITLLPPTIMMGGTLPALGRYLASRNVAIGRSISRLYYLNSFGAVAGCILGGFFLVRLYGLPGSMLIAASLNLFAAALTWWIARAERGEQAPDVAAADEAARSADAGIAPELRARMARVALVVIGVSGAVSMTYQVAWTRLLALVMGSAGTSFAVMLAAFILGITLGSYLLSLKRDDTGYFRVLGWAQIGIGLTSLLAVLGYERVPLWLNQARFLIQPNEQAYPLYEGFKLLLCMAVMLLPTTFMGATVPAASRVVADAVSSLGSRVGNVFAVNTLGTVIGALTAGWLLLPAVGIRATVEIAVAMNLVLGCVVFLAERGLPDWRPSRLAMVAALVAVIGGQYALLAGKWDIRYFLVTVYRTKQRIESFYVLRYLAEQRKILYHKDGHDASVTISHDVDPRRNLDNISIIINGKPDASSTGDMQTQLLLGHLPMMIHRKPEDVLVVGLGSGVTAGAVTQHDAKSIECVELIPEIREAARFFKRWNHDAADNPAINHILADAKTHILVSEKKYDLIISEPTNPWITGVANLFSREFLEAARARLKPGGMFVLWFHLYEMSDKSVFSMIETAQGVYPYSTMFNLGSSDVLVVMSTEPIVPDFARMERALATPAVKADLAQFGIEGLMPILAMQMTNRTSVPVGYSDFGWQLTDMHPQFEFEAVRSLYIRHSAMDLRMLDRRSLPKGQTGLWMETVRPSEVPDEDVFERYFQAIMKEGSFYPRAGGAWTELWETYHPGSRRLATARAQLRTPADMTGLAAMRGLGDDADDRILELRFRTLWAEYDATRTYARVPDATELEHVARLRLARKPNEQAVALLVLGQVALDRGDWSEAKRILMEAHAAAEAELEPDEVEPERRNRGAVAKTLLSRVGYQSGDVELAMSAAEQAVAESKNPAFRQRAVIALFDARALAAAKGGGVVARGAAEAP